MAIHNCASGEWDYIMLTIPPDHASQLEGEDLHELREAWGAE